MFHVFLSAQDNSIDSLENVLQHASDDRSRITLLNDIALLCKSADPLKTRKYANRAYDLASKIKDVSGQANALHRKELSYYYLDSYDTAMDLFHQSLNVAKGTSDSSLFAQAYSAIGNVYRLEGINDTSLVFMQRALRIYNELKDEKNVAACLSAIGDTYLFASQYDQALEYHLQALKIAEEQNDRYRQAFCLSSIGNNYNLRGDFRKSIDYHQRAIDIAKSIGELNIVAGSLGVIADDYSNLYDYPKAIEADLKALGIAEKRNDRHNTAFIYGGMSDIFYRQEEYDSAVKYINKSISLSMQIGDYDRTCDGLVTLVKYDIEKKDTMEARKLADKALAMAMQYNYPEHVANALHQQGKIWMLQGKYTLAENLLHAALDSLYRIGDDQQISETLGDYVVTLTALGKIDDAITQGEKGILIAQKIKSPGLELVLANGLADAYEMKGDLRKALYYSRQTKTLSDSVNSEDKTKKETALLLKYRFDQEIERNKIEQAKRDEERDAHDRQLRIIIMSAIVALVLVISLAFFIFRGYRQKQKANDIIISQKKIVEEKNREITDSINYAQNIQQAMLPAKDAVAELFSKHFIMFQPRDIVSGDFFWIGEKEELRFFAVADCTGHGVPGGFMSMLGITLLNEILSEKNIVSPAEILNELRARIVQSLNQAGKTGDILSRDGMDIALCCIDTKNNLLRYAGANNSLLIIHDNSITELGPDKQPVGIHISEKPFTEKTFQLKGNELLVAYSDGFADQFGGFKGKKMMYRHFRELLLQASLLPVEKAADFLAKAFDEWKGDHAQVDDVCVMGVHFVKA